MEQHFPSKNIQLIVHSWQLDPIEETTYPQANVICISYTPYNVPEVFVMD